MYAVMGVTGQVGRAVAQRLLQRGESVRAVLRDTKKAAMWREAGADATLAAYDDAAALAQAFRGADGVFVMIPPNFAPSLDFREPMVFVDAIAKAIGTIRPAKTVLLSTIGADQAEGTGLLRLLHLAEKKLEALGLPVAFLRAGWFMENCAWDVPAARESGVIDSYLTPLDRGIPMVATADVGKAGADLLLQSWQGVRRVEVNGPALTSPLQIAEAFTQALGQPVRAVEVPRGQWQERFVQQGMPADRTRLRIEMVDAFNSGRVHFGVAGTESVRGEITIGALVRQLVREH